MSSPPDPGTAIATPPRHVGRTGSLLAGRDRLRLREFNRRRSAGEPEIQAWGAVVTDERIGLKSFRGKGSVPVATLERTLANFLARCSPAECAEAVAKVRQRASSFAAEAWDVVESITRHGDKDPENGRLKLSGAKVALSAVGVPTSAQPVPASPTFAFQANVAFLAPATALADEETRRMARQLADRAAGVLPPSGAVPTPSGA